MKLYAIRYAKEFIYGTKGTVFRDAENGTDKVENFSFCYYLMELEGRTHLVDTGFRDGSLATEMGVTLLSVEEELEQVFGRESVPDGDGGGDRGRKTKSVNCRTYVGKKGTSCCGPIFVPGHWRAYSGFFRHFFRGNGEKICDNRR